MQNPDDTLSVLHALTEAKRREKEIIEEAALGEQEAARKEAKTGKLIQRSEIAARLYPSGEHLWCIRHEFTAKRWDWSTGISRQVSLGEYVVFLAIRLKVPIVADASGAKLFGEPIEEQRPGAAFYLPDGKAKYDYGLENIDKNKCESEKLRDLEISDLNSRKFGAGTLKELPISIDHALQTGKRWNYLKGDGTIKSDQSALNILQEVNVERLKQAYAIACLEHIESARTDVTNLRSQFS
jgi:hypothetical protein